MHVTIDVETHQKEAFIDITDKVRELVNQSTVKEGVCFLYVPHTTSAITINENADISVREDILSQLVKIVPFRGDYLHSEGNAPAHIKASIIGQSSAIFIKDGQLVLGTWQGIFFCEFDGPRKRRVMLKIMKG
jgi:secondary thiamine-phosphate synthase enzyme